MIVLVDKQSLPKCAVLREDRPETREANWSFIERLAFTEDADGLLLANEPDLAFLRTLYTTGDLYFAQAYKSESEFFRACIILIFQLLFEPVSLGITSL